jgi:hypothetical protein
MKRPTIETVWKDAHRCFDDSRDNPVIHDLVYCGMIFLREAMKASSGHRPQSSRKIAIGLIAKRSNRLRLYRRMNRINLPKHSPSTPRKHV